MIQGAAELLPISSSAHVIVAEKLMKLDPSSPEMTMLLIMLHTGTMFAVIVYFWKSWKRDYFSSSVKRMDYLMQLVIATFCTGVVFIVVKEVIEKVFLKGAPKAEIEILFSNLGLVGAALFAAGVLITISGIRSQGRFRGEGSEIQVQDSILIGLIQGLSIPFRGFSRSGSTISTGLLRELSRSRVEEFSFALAVILTPAAIAFEGKRLLEANKAGAHLPIGHLMLPGMIGMVFSFLAGLAALKLLSKWLEAGQWKLFGFYCVAASIAVLALHFGMGL